MQMHLGRKHINYYIIDGISLNQSLLFSERKDIFCSVMHSVHFIYGHMALNMLLRTNHLD